MALSKKIEVSDLTTSRSGHHHHRIFWPEKSTSLFLRGRDDGLMGERLQQSEEENAGSSNSSSNSSSPTKGETHSGGW
jgi:hypothetical protein